MTNENSNSKNVVANPFENSSNEQLATKLTLAQKTKNRDEALKITEELKKRNSPAKSDDFMEDFNKKHEDLKKRMNSKEKSKRPTEKELKEFFTKEVTTFTSTINDHVNRLEDSKDAEIKRLQGQLEGALLDVPGFMESLSFKRRRLVNITKKLNSFEEKGGQNYPKNLLIYAMAITRSKYRGAGQGIKRNWIKLRWNKKSNNIKAELANLEAKLEPVQGDSDHKNMIRSLLKEKIKKAQDAHIEKVKLSTYGKDDEDINKTA